MKSDLHALGVEPGDEPHLPGVEDAGRKGEEILS